MSELGLSLAHDASNQRHKQNNNHNCRSATLTVPAVIHTFRRESRLTQGSCCFESEDWRNEADAASA
jgi:hypothetical protein